MLPLDHNDTQAAEYGGYFARRWPRKVMNNLKLILGKYCGTMFPHSSHEDIVIGTLWRNHLNDTQSCRSISDMSATIIAPDASAHPRKYH